MSNSHNANPRRSDDLFVNKNIDASDDASVQATRKSTRKILVIVILGLVLGLAIITFALFAGIAAKTVAIIFGGALAAAGIIGIYFIGFKSGIPMWLQLPIMHSPRSYVSYGREEDAEDHKEAKHSASTPE